MRERRMTWKEIQKKIHEKYDDKILKWYEHNENRIYVDIDPSDWIEFGRFLFNEFPTRFIIASAVDTPREGIDILYHFDFHNLPQVLSVRVFVKKPELEIESMAPYIKGTEWIEREMNELLGIQFKNHPNMKHLILPEDWPEGKYPLRRDQ
jgi:NADH:ubiquinone oxidoreductase subunit C